MELYESKKKGNASNSIFSNGKKINVSRLDINNLVPSLSNKYVVFRNEIHGFVGKEHYKLVQNEWIQLPDIPLNESHFTLNADYYYIEYHDKIYCIIGWSEMRQNSRRQNISTCYYDYCIFDGNNWGTVSTVFNREYVNSYVRSPFGNARNCFVWQDKICFMGDGGILSYWEEGEPFTLSGQRTLNRPDAKKSSVAVYNNKIYSIKLYGESFDSLGTWVISDNDEKRIEFIVPVFDRRTGDLYNQAKQLIVCNNKLYAFCYTSAHPCLVYVFNDSTEEWVRIDDTMFSLTNDCAVSLNNEIWLMKSEGFDYIYKYDSVLKNVAIS